MSSDALLLQCSSWEKFWNQAIGLSNQEKGHLLLCHQVFPDTIGRGPPDEKKPASLNGQVDL